MIQAISEPLQTSFRSENYSSTAGRRPLPSRRLAVLQDKKAANQVISLSEFAQLSSGTLDFLSGFLSWDAQYLQWSSQPQMAGGCGLFIGGDPNGEMSEVTRCDILTRVHNGRNFNHCETLLEEQES